MIKIYVRFDCPYCIKVINRIEKLNLEKGKDYELIDAKEGTPGEDMVLQIGGKGQLPFLIDGKISMYESDEIIRYIEKMS